MGRGSRRPALAWAGPLSTARRHSGAAERPTLNGANHPSALPVAASGSPGGTGSRLDGSTRVIQPHRIPALHGPGLSSHARIALWHVRWMSAAWVWAAAAASRLEFGRLRLLRGCFAQSRWVRAGCTSCSTARLSTVTLPRAAPPGLSIPACASPSWARQMLSGFADQRRNQRGPPLPFAPLPPCP
jgi:hypothetical protein